MNTEVYPAYLRDVHGLPGDWTWYSLDAGHMRSDSVPEGFTRVKGAVAPVITRGKRKGRRNWARRDKSTDKTFFVKDSDIESWCIENDVCPLCANSRERYAGSVNGVAAFRPCECAATNQEQALTTSVDASN